MNDFRMVKSAAPLILAVAALTAANPYQSVTAWWYDPLNTSGAANDAGLCTSQAHPCLTAKQINYRMGGLSPRITNGSGVVLNVMSSNVGLSDPLTFTPCMGNSVPFGIECQMAQVGSSCALSAVTVRNIVTSGSMSQLKVTATCITGAGQFIINATHPSRAFARTSLGANQWTMTQPLTHCDVATNTCARTEVNTWAPGDTITVWNMLHIDVDHVGTSCGDGAGYIGFTGCAFASGEAFLDGPFPVLWEDEEVSGSMALDGVWGEALNFYHAGGFFSFFSDFVQNSQAQWSGLVPGIEGGLLQVGSVVQGAYFGLGADIGNNAAIAGVFGFSNTQGTDVFLEGTTVVLKPSSVYAGGGAQIWGPGFLQEQAGAVITYPGGSAATSFLNGFAATGGPGVSVEYGDLGQTGTCATNVNGGAGTATNCGISMTPAHFDASFAGGGCAGTCWGPGGMGVIAQ